MTTAPSTTMPKSRAPRDKRLAGICRRFRQMAANSSENGIDRNIPNTQRGTALRRDDGVFDVVDVSDQADFTDVDLLQSRFDEAAACVDVVIDELLLDLSDIQPVSNQLVGIEPDLVFTCGTAESGDLDNVGYRLEVFFDHPLLERL